MTQVLVVDDDPLNRRTLVRVLEHAGYDVAHAHDGLAALTWLDGEGAFNGVIVSDGQMPVLDGLGLWRALPTGLQSRLVFYTGDPGAFLFFRGAPVVQKGDLQRLLVEVALIGAIGQLASSTTEV